MTQVLKDKRILLVDDEPELREIYADFFSSHGAQILEATNGVEAFQIIKSKPVDIVISDIRMPGGDGVELLKNIKANDYDVPTVMLITGYADLTTEAAYDFGAEAIFSKPCDLNIMLEAVKKALTPIKDRWQRRTERFPVNANIVLKLPGFEQSIQSHLINIGRGGMFVAVGNVPQCLNQGVEFSIQLGASESLKGKGICRWIRSKASENQFAGMGVEFEELESEGLAMLLKFLDAIRPKAFIPQS